MFAWIPSIDRQPSVATTVRCLALAMALCHVSAAHSQESVPTPSDARDKSILGEVIVTAQKRGAQDLQDVPISIQAITADTLERAGVKDFLDAAKLAPSLTIIDQGTGQYQVYMRGIITGPAATSATQDKPLTSIYVDEVPVSFANFNPNFNMFDVERVEVLRGPQGTLYGAGSMGGNIRIVTVEPNTRELAAKIEAQTAWTRDGDESYAFRGLVNFPLIEDKLGLRIAGTTSQDGAFVDNPLLGEENIEALDRDTARLAARWVPTEPLAVTLNLLWQQMEADDRRRRMIPGTQTLFDNVPAEGEFTTVQSLLEPFVDEQLLSNATITYDFAWAQLLSSTSYFDREFTNFQQGFFAEFFDKLINGDIAVSGWVIDDWDVNDFVQELRLISPDRRLDWVIGAFYADQFARFVDDYPVENFEERTGLPTTGFGAPMNNLFKGNTENEQRQYAVFGELTFAFTQRLEGTVGLRWFDWEQDFFQFFSGFFNGGVSIKDETTEAQEFTPKFSLSYDLSNDAMIYATAAKGYRLGGVNDPVPPEPCADELAGIGLTEAPSTFGPDSLWNYEIGTKTSWLDRRLTLNAAVYHIDWTDIQTRRFLESCGFFFTENVGKAESTGVELELISSPAEGLTLALTGSYTKAELAEDVPNLNAQKGDKAPFVPEFAASATIDYYFPITVTLDGYARLDVQYVGSRTTSYAGTTEMPAYDLGNLHLGLEGGDGRWVAEVFATNLWDEEAILVESEVSFTGAGAEQVIERPRTIGLTLRWNF